MAKILFMEEEHNLRELAEQFLSLEGFEISTFANGEELLKEFSKDLPPDVVILDLNVENRMGAVPTLKKLFEMGFTGKAIVSSGYLFSDEKVNGFDAVLPKPYWPHELKKIIKEVLKEKAGA